MVRPYKYLGPKPVVVTAIMKETIAIIGGRVICRNRSPVLSACQALIRMAMTAIKYGGVVKRRVSTLLFPSPPTTLRKSAHPL